MPDIPTFHPDTMTGWAVRVDGSISSGSVSFKLTPCGSAGSHYRRSQRWLGTKPSCGLDGVVFEAAARRRQGAVVRRTCGGFMATFQMGCDVEGMPYEDASVRTIQKFAAGNGNTLKRSIVAAMEQGSHKPRDNRETDVLALLSGSGRYHNKKATCQKTGSLGTINQRVLTCYNTS